MKHFKLGFLAFATLLTVQNLQAQTVDDIVNKHIAAQGGKEKLATLQTVRMEGLMNTNGTDVNITVTKSNKVGSRIDIAVMGMNGYKVFNATNGWNFMPFAGQKEPQPMKEEELKPLLATGLDLQGGLFNYKEKGIQLELLGNEKVDSAECFKIKATFKNGNVMTYFIDAKTYFIDKLITTQFLNGSMKEISSNFSNYKPTGNGFIFPFTTTNAQGQIDFSKIEVNIPIDAKTFTVN